MKCLRKFLYYWTFLLLSSDEFVAVDDDDVCTAPITAYKDILMFVQSYKNILYADSNDENEMDNAASSEMRNIMKSMRSYLDAHSNNEMNK
ncbi:hypothetical protein TNCV_2039801 [Trichonephila clavipes]|nr:hypothetical protein TNCV_2039801 [Trichonephila clavipes]